jgi:hypothetical protein
MQELFLRSSRPLAALEMRQDLKHWPQALALAQQLAPDRLPQLNKEHAGLLELVGDHAAAATHYQQVRGDAWRQQRGVKRGQHARVELGWDNVGCEGVRED